LPVLGLGIALQYLSSQVTLLILGLAVGIGIPAAAPTLLHQPTAATEKHLSQPNDRTLAPGQPNRTHGREAFTRSDRDVPQVSRSSG
jgi:hypothetical protein